MYEQTKQELAPSLPDHISRQWNRGSSSKYFGMGGNQSKFLVAVFNVAGSAILSYALEMAFSLRPKQNCPL